MVFHKLPFKAESGKKQASKIMPIIKTERAELFYQDYRSKEDQIPLLLIHGAGGNHEDWPLALRESANVIAIDLAGHGQSPVPARKSIVDYAADVVSLLEALKIPEVIVAGHSMGGAISLTLALDYPQHIKAMILVGTGARLEVNPLIINGLLDKPEEAIALIIKWQWAKHIVDEVKAANTQRLMTTAFDITRGDYLACDGFDIRERLGEISVPTLILAGTLDKMTPFDWSKTLVEKIPNARLEMMENGGHMFPLEQPEKTRDVIVSWLANQ
jgi:pimeloyl-ACP methyl ester carboxylesterase